MPKTLLLLTAIGGTTLSWMCMPPTDSPSTDSPKPEQGGGRQQVRNVTSLYNEYCGKCHGMNGEGGGGGTKTLLTRDKFDQKWDKPFFDATKNGVPDMGMEAYGQTLSDPEVWALVVHIRELQAKYLRQTEGGPKATDGVYKAKQHSYKVETVVDGGLRTPWSIDWLPDGKMLVTNRPGTMNLVVNGKLGAQVTGLPESVEQGQGGLMDVAVHPSYKSNGWVYLSYTEPAKSGRGGMTKVVRGKLKISGDQAAWSDQQTIWEANQQYYTGAGVHFGSKIVFDKGYVYFTVGERGSNMGAQSLETPFGKVMRLHDDGKVPTDNPYVNTAGAEKATWSYGHRNQQGLTVDSEGRLWDTEHGPRGGDELNEIKKGANYGWPLAVWSINYNDSPFRTPWMTDGKTIVQPIFRWLPSIGASGLDTMKGSAFPNWKGDLIAGGLAGNNLDRFRIKDGKLVEREELIWGMGRIRDVAIGADGFIYIALNGPDKIIRLVPAK